MMISTESLNALHQSVTMSSREIAEMTGNTHGEVKRLIKSLETAQRLSQPLTAWDYEADGTVRQEYRLNKRDSVLAVAGLYGGSARSLAGAGKSGASARFHQSGRSGARLG